MDRDKLIRTIEQLMGIARDGGASEAEVETATKKALAMMEKHEIEQGELYEKQKTTFTEEDVCSAVVREHCKHDLYEKRLLSLVCELTGTKGFLSKVPNGFTPKGNRRYRHTFNVYGMKDDVLIATSMYSELLTTIRVMAVARLGTWKQPHYHYAEGFISGLHSKVLHEKQKQAKPATTTALISAKDAIIRKYKQSLGLKKGRTGRTDKSRHGAAYTAGVADGREHQMASRGDKVAVTRNRLANG